MLTAFNANCSDLYIESLSYITASPRTHAAFACRRGLERAACLSSKNITSLMRKPVANSKFQIVQVCCAIFGAAGCAWCFDSLLIDSIERIMFSITRRAAMLAKRVSHNSFKPVLQRPRSTQAHARKERQADAVLYCVAAIGAVTLASYPSRAELEELGHPSPKRIVRQASEAIDSATKVDESLLTRVSISCYAVMYPSSLRPTRAAVHSSSMII
jgi:hypothetical protein